ncbi:hypothetical protein C8R45DRAFT_937684 [Mycena sanguinolenta]|nr:hypothetical protein C8R45DRAFT_937684 [Mycena sanguinolenta]
MKDLRYYVIWDLAHELFRSCTQVDADFAPLSRERDRCHIGITDLVTRYNKIKKFIFSSRKQPLKCFRILGWESDSKSTQVAPSHLARLGSRHKSRQRLDLTQLKSTPRSRLGRLESKSRQHYPTEVHNIVVHYAHYLDNQTFETEVLRSNLTVALFLLHVQKRWNELEPSENSNSRILSRMVINQVTSFDSFDAPSAESHTDLEAHPFGGP